MGLVSKANALESRAAYLRGLIEMKSAAGAMGSRFERELAALEHVIPGLWAEAGLRVDREAIQRQASNALRLRDIKAAKPARDRALFAVIEAEEDRHP